MIEHPIVQIVVTKRPEGYRVILMAEGRTVDRYVELNSTQALEKLDAFIHALVPAKDPSVVR